MRKHITLLTLAWGLRLAAPAAVQLGWTVETTRVQPATFEVVRGETVELEAKFNNAGRPLAVDGWPFEIFWQTNGMGASWWTAPATAAANRVAARFTPAMDPGASTVVGFLGSTGRIYRAAFTLRFRHGPGAIPNALPLPVPVIDFAKVRVLNPPWSGGGGGGVDTNAVRDIVRPMIADATNGIRSVDGAARPLPKYLHLYEADDSYPDAAQEYYRSRGDGKVDGGCSSVRSGGFLSRNFDFPFDDRAEFVVRMSASTKRFASVGVAQVGTNLTEAIVTSGKPEYSRLYKWLPGATVDGINENGVACNINVVDGDPQTSGWHNDTGDLHPFAAVRWILDNATNAQHAATYIAANIRFPEGWSQNYHYMIADPTSTYIVENGEAYPVPPPSSAAGASAVLTNFRLYPTPSDGEGQERYVALTNGANITSQWWTLTYTPTGYRPSDLPGITGEGLTQLFNYWASKPREAHRCESFDGHTWWQSVHTSVYDLTNRVLRVAVQETDDWYTFQVPSSGAKVDAYTKAETDGLLSGKLDKDDVIAPSIDESASGKAADAYETESEFIIVRETAESALNEAQGATLVADQALTKAQVATEIADQALQLGDTKLDAPAATDVTDGHVAVFKKVTNPDDTVTVKVEDGGTKISHTDPNFTNAVIQTMKGVTPQPSPELRLWDPVLNRWVILKSVNMNITLELE